MTISTKEQEPETPEETGFPEGKVRALEEKISHSRWVVPVLPDQELQALLQASIRLATTGEDANNAACQRFYSDSLTVSFTKILTDDAVTSWKPNIQLCVRDNCETLVKLCALKLHDPRFLHLLTLAFNANNKFHNFNASRTYELSPSSESSPQGQSSSEETEVFARSYDRRNPRGWLVHFINVFGEAGGFVRLRERLESVMGLKKASASPASGETDQQESQSDMRDESPVDDTIEPYVKMEEDGETALQSGEERVTAAWQLLRPFVVCHELLTPHTITTYMLPALECVPSLLESLSDEELKKEARGNENKTDTVSCLIRAAKCLCARTQDHQHLIKSLEMFRLKMILRLLQMTSLSGKMSALNEINQLIGTLAQQPRPDWLTSALITNWIRENKVLEVVLRDSLHQPQYVERLEKMCRFLIKERALTDADLDAIWRAQQGKHEAIVKNVHDLLAKLAWDFTPEQLDHLFDCFKASWASSNRKQSDRVLEVMRRLAEDDKDGVMANKVLALLWDAAHSPNTDVVDVALHNLVKILDYSCSQERDQQKTVWINKCVEELKKSPEWTLPALKLMREICGLYEVGATGAGARPHLTRQQLIDRLQSQHSLVVLVTDSLCHYVDTVRNKLDEGEEVDWERWLPDGRYPHAAQVHERLGFLRFLLKDGQLWLCAQQAEQMWACLAERPATPGDREACFRWFSKLMGDEPDLDPNISLNFFTNNVLKLDPKLLTHNGIKCFERFFKSVNIKEGKLKAKRKGFALVDPDLIGLDYLWRVITECDDEISSRGSELVRETCAVLAPAPQHEAFLTRHTARLQLLHQHLQSHRLDVAEICSRMCRILRALQEYVNECDRRFSPERQILPLYRAGRGKNCLLVVRLNLQTGQRQTDDLELYTHSNETLHALRANIQRKLKCAAGSNVKVELYVNGELLDSSHDRKMLSQIPLRDKTVIAAKVCSSGCGSSNESSSDSSASSPPPPGSAETALPGVILSQAPYYIPFILQLEHVGVSHDHPGLAEAAHTLTQISPPHKNTMERLHEALMAPDDTKLKDMLYGPAPPTVAYHVQILYTMAMPSCETLLERSCVYRLECVKRAPLLVQCLSDSELLGTCAHDTRRVGFLALVRLAKLVLNTLENLLEKLRTDNVDGVPVLNSRTDVLKEALQNTSLSGELIDKAVAVKLANTLAEQVLSGGEESGQVSGLLRWQVPTTSTVRALCALAHVAAQPHPHRNTHPDDVTLVRECMDVITICMVLGRDRIEALIQEPWWQKMALYLLIECPSPQVRVCVAEQLLTLCALQGPEAARALLEMLSDTVGGERLERHARHANQLLQLVCRLVALAPHDHSARPHLANQVEWLRRVLQSRERVDDVLLEGRLNLTKELLLHSPAHVKYQYGAHPDHPDSGLIQEVATEFLWPYSWAWAGGGGDTEPPPPLCRTASAASAACDLLLALTHGCVANMAALTKLLIHMFYGEKSQPLTEWEYVPSVGTRSPAGLVGLKNAGATCYMNSVLQQLYCVSAVRDEILVLQEAATDPNEDFSGEDLQNNAVDSTTEQSSGDYNVTILKQVQAIFAYLRYSRLQYYVPKGLWTHFKLQGEPVNLREQQDAVEFFMSLVESLDEALKTLGKPQLMARTLGGTYSDQKICRECPHRYCKEEPFSVVSLDIRNMSRLQESLEAYVRGELLEGADAYHCDKCNKKVLTVKRLCLNKLPPVLVIQLKRFEYDFDKVCPIKFNDYFEFPRHLDVQPYTVWGLAEAEGEEGMWEHTPAPDTNYVLSGIVVHSGQASGGHYYSYVLLRDNGTEAGRWVKLDDGDVSECPMHDDEEMKAQCFGGEYMAEMYDPCLKRQTLKRQKRWWNAYMLFYTRRDTVPHLQSLDQAMANMTLKESLVPRPIWQSVRRSNVRFLHHQEQFSVEHFALMKKLCCLKLHVPHGHTSPVWGAEQEEMSMLAVQLATKFLFHVGFRTKKNLRGSASDWYDILCQHLRYSQPVRAWFATHAVFNHPQRLCEHLLLSPSAEVRVAFMKMIVSLAHFSTDDPPVSSGYCAWYAREEALSLSDQLLLCTRALAAPPPATLHSPHPALLSHATLARHLPLLYIMFHTYAAFGIHEKLQLIRLKVLEVVMALCMDESSLVKYPYQFPDSAKVHQVISVLVRCCDVSEHCKSANEDCPPLSNPYMERDVSVPSVCLPQPVCYVLYNRTTTYAKKLVDEGSGVEEGVRLMQYLCWEHPGWSRALLEELLWQMGYAYCHELRRHAEALTAVLLIDDSWQPHRIHNAFEGVSEERSGLLETASRARHKRAYACIKLMVAVMCRAPCAVHAVHAQPESRRRWRQALAWLQDQLHRYGSSYSYDTWSPPSNSNESGGYTLERSNSARNTLERAYQLCPDDEEEDEEEETERSAGGAGWGEDGDDDCGILHHHEPPTVSALSEVGHLPPLSPTHAHPDTAETRPAAYKLTADVTGSPAPAPAPSPPLPDLTPQL